MVVQHLHTVPSVGSTPTITTKKNLYPCLSMDRILRYERGDGGSIPSGGANFISHSVSGYTTPFGAETS